MSAASNALAEFLVEKPKLAILTGAGVSTGSGIPDYRGREGNPKVKTPILIQDFTREYATRQRYWARSFVGWQRFSKAQPNVTHFALANMELTGKVDTLITQNVDGLHQEAGSEHVVSLHGELSRVTCLQCDTVLSRSVFQDQLRAANPDWHSNIFATKPDGDAELAEESLHDFSVPQCEKCGGTVKPDVVMFGENVPKHRVNNATAAVERSDGLLIIGSSLTVFSGFRFARHAAALKMPIVIVNQGRTRADHLATLKLDADCASVLPAALSKITSSQTTA